MTPIIDNVNALPYTG